MYPTLKPGDRLVARRVPPDALEYGDIVIAHVSTDKLTAHRLVAIRPNGEGFLKGDSMLTPDPAPVNLSSILGRVDAVIRKNQLIHISRGPRARFKKIHAWLSLNCLTTGSLKLGLKTVFQKYLPDDPSVNAQREMHLIVSIINEQALRASIEPEWEKLYDLALREGVAGLLYYYIKGSNAPDAFLDRLEMCYRQTAASNLIHIKALEALEEVLSNEKLDIMLLKGASLLDIFYPGLGMRPMDDVDILVRPKDFDRLVNTLSSQGYERNARIPHVVHKAALTLDIHTHALNIDRITSREGLFPKGMEPIWRESLHWKEGFYRIRRPCDMDNVFLLSQHLLKHSFSKFIWLVDIRQIVKDRDNMFWEKLIERMEYLEQKKPFHYIVFLLEYLFHLDRPPASGLSVQPSDFSRLEKGMLKAKLKGESLNRIGPLLLLFYISGLKGRLSFLRETVFPKEEILEQEFSRFSNHKKWAFYPNRVVHMIILSLRHILYFLRAFIES